MRCEGDAAEAPLVPLKFGQIPWGLGKWGQGLADGDEKSNGWWMALKTRLDYTQHALTCSVNHKMPSSPESPTHRCRILLPSVTCGFPRFQAPKL